MGQIEIPESMVEFARRFPSRIEISKGFSDGINSYGILEHDCVKVLLLSKRCIHCGYNSLFKRELWESPNPMHMRHTYEKGLEWVFAWHPESGIDLETAFNTWLEENKEAVDGYRSYRRGVY